MARHLLPFAKVRQYISIDEISEMAVLPLSDLDINEGCNISDSYYILLVIIAPLYRVARKKKHGTVDTVDFSGLCSDQQLSFFHLAG